MRSLDRTPLGLSLWPSCDTLQSEALLASYRTRVTQDLERWVAAGLVAPEHRAAILGSIPESRRLNAATALGFTGAVLFGLAVIAFIAANWDALARVARYALILMAFGMAAGGAAWAAAARRPVLRNMLLTLAALIFAAAIGLTGQIFDIAGDPRTALRSAGLAAALLAVAGGSSGAALAALLLVFLGDASDNSRQQWLWLAAFSAGGLVLAWRWRSAPLLHGGSLGLVVAIFMLVGRSDEPAAYLLAASAGFAAAAVAVRRSPACTTASAARCWGGRASARSPVSSPPVSPAPRPRRSPTASPGSWCPEGCSPSPATMDMEC
jgi:uncharacterized membrane protein